MVMRYNSFLWKLLKFISCLFWVAHAAAKYLAQQPAQRSERSVAVIATASAHPRRRYAQTASCSTGAARPLHWHTIEEPLNLAVALHQAADLADVIVLDCITVWLSNWLYLQENPDGVETAGISSRYSQGALDAIEELLRTLAILDG